MQPLVVGSSSVHASAGQEPSLLRGAGRAIGGGGGDEATGGCAADERRARPRFLFRLATTARCFFCSATSASMAGLGAFRAGTRLLELGQLPGCRAARACRGARRGSKNSSGLPLFEQQHRLAQCGRCGRPGAATPLTWGGSSSIRSSGLRSWRGRVASCRFPRVVERVLRLEVRATRLFETSRRSWRAAFHPLVRSESPRAGGDRPRGHRDPRGAVPASHERGGQWAPPAYSSPSSSFLPSAASRVS